MFGRYWGFFYEALSLGEEEAIGLAVLLLLELGETFEGCVRVGHTSVGSSLSSSFFGPPTTRMSPSCRGVSGFGRVPPFSRPLIASTVRSFLRWSWRSARDLPIQDWGASISMRASSDPSSR